MRLASLPTAADAPSFRIRVDAATDDEWHGALGGFADIHYEQTAIYSSGQRGERSSRLLVEEGSTVVGGTVVGLYRVPPTGSGLALVRFGPFWRPCGETLNAAARRQVIEALIAEYAVRRGLYLVVRPRPHPDCHASDEAALEEAGFRRARTSSLDRYFVNLALSEAEQRKSLGQKWRYNLKASEANHIDVRIDDGPTAVRLFQLLYAGMVERKGLNYAGVDIGGELPRFAALPQAMRLRIALAFVDGEAVAGLAFGVMGDLAYYVFGASNARAIALHAGYVLQWHVIRHLSAVRGLGWYELGGPGDPGIRQFKKGLSGKRGCMLAVDEFHYGADWRARLVAKGLYALRDARNAVQHWQRKRTRSTSISNQ